MRDSARVTLHVQRVTQGHRYLADGAGIHFTSRATTGTWITLPANPASSASGSALMAPTPSTASTEKGSIV